MRHLRRKNNPSKPSGIPREHRFRPAESTHPALSKIIICIMQISAYDGEGIELLRWGSQCGRPRPRGSDGKVTTPSVKERRLAMHSLSTSLL